MSLQLSTQLKPAVMFDHKGTYMRGIALQQKDARVVVATGSDFEEDITGAFNLPASMRNTHKAILPQSIDFK